MTTEARIAPKNSLLLVMDRDSGKIPDSMDGKLVVSTPSCIAVGTLSEVDGETSVVLTNETAVAYSRSGLHKIFSGFLATPSKEAHICTVLLHTVAKLSVLSAESSVEIWAENGNEPS